MSDFMVPEITPKTYGVCVETVNGTHYFPQTVAINAEEASAYIDSGSTIESVTVVRGYFGRYSAPGYLDCTEWEYDTNLRRLKKTLREMYGSV